MIEVAIAAGIVGGFAALTIGLIKALFDFVASKISPKLSQKNTAQQARKQELREQEQRERQHWEQEQRKKAEAERAVWTAHHSLLDEEEERRQADARKNAEDENVNLGDYANAETAIKYRQEAEDAWVRTSDLPADLRRRFLVALDEDPRQDIPKLLSSVEEEHKKRLRPFSDETANDALEQARTISVEAASEFKKVYDTLGDRNAAAKILKKIESEFGPSEQTTTAIKNRRRERVQKQKQRIQARREQEQLSKARREQKGRKRTGAPFKGISFF